ncbi:putative ankyrin repeat protein [Xylaria digitata]|nr:putative ankyrin repeat protein [Xylaria digitata]
MYDHEELDGVETMSLGMYEAGGEEGSGFHIHNVAVDQYHRAEVLQRTGAIAITCSLENVVHGVMSTDSDRYATLIVMQWLFQPKGSRRISEATIELLFDASSDDSDIEVEKISFLGTYSLMSTTQEETIAKSRDATAGVEQFASISLTSKWEKTVTRTTSDAITLSGGKRVINDRPPNRIATWTLSENQSQPAGIPASLRVGVLVSRDDEEKFFCKDDVLILQPSPDDKGTRPNKNVIYDDDEELGKFDLDTIYDGILDSASTKSTETNPLSENEESASLSSELKQHKLRLDINKPWGWSGSSYDDYDVITVHGIRDDYRTAWTDKGGAWWVKDRLFKNLSIREIDYSYEINEESTIYQSNGIQLHAGRLIEEYAEVRRKLEETEIDRPVIWICHDLGGTIVKAIFLGTPHRFRSFDCLENQMLKLILLPGIDIREDMLSKVKSLAQQVHSFNQLFLAIKILDRAVIINIFTQNGRDSLKQKAIGNNATDTAELENTDDLPNPSVAFLRYAYLSGHSFEASGRYRISATDHVDLIRADPNSDDNWLRAVNDIFNVTGSIIRVDYQIIQLQARLLSLAPPTRTFDTPFDPLLPLPPVVAWIYKQTPYATFSKSGKGPRLMHIHGEGNSLANISELSRLLYTVIYFEFDQFDSRYRTISSMLIYFINALVWRFWADHKSFITEELTFLSDTRSWSSEDLYHLYTVLRDNDAWAAHELTFFIGCFDQCLEDQQQWFLKHILEDQSYSDAEYRMILSTLNSGGLPVGSIPDEARINLVHCPAIGGANSRSTRELQSRLAGLIARRPIYKDFQLQLESLLEECRDAPYLGRIILTWLGNYHRGKPKSEIANKINKLSPVTPQNIVHVFIHSLAPEPRSKASHVFNWIKHASEPWSPEALTEALAVHEFRDEEPLLSDLDVEGTMSDVEETFCGIIISQNRNVKFSHTSFYNLPEVGIERPSEEWASRANSTIAETCLRYFQLRVVQDRLKGFCQENLEGGPWVTPLDVAIIYHSRLNMAEYAVRFWPRHYRDSGRFKPTNLVHDLFASRESRVAWEIPFWLLSNTFTRLQRSYISTLPVLAMLELDDLVKEKIASEMGRPSFQKDCWFAITEAARMGNKNITQQLLRLVAVDEEELQTALFWATAGNNVAIVDALLGKIQDLKTFKWPESIIIRAAASGLDNLLYVILKSGYDINKTSNYWRAPLGAVIAWFDRVPTMKILLDSEPKPDMTLGDKDGDTPMMVAIKRGNPHMMDLLLQYAPIIDVEKGRMLEIALKWSKHRAVGIIIEANADLVNVNLLTLHLGPPLVAAADWGLRGCVHALLNNGANPNVECVTGSALYKAVARNHQDIAEILLEWEPKSNIDVVPPGKPMLMIQAVRTSNTELVSLLIKHIPQINFVDPGSNGFHETPLSWACFQGNLDMHKSIDVSWTDSYRTNALHFALYKPFIVRKLLEMGVFVDTYCNSGTALHIAARHGLPKSIEVLLENNPKPNLDYVGCTPLQIACMHNHPECIRILQKAGANTTFKNNKGDDAVDIMFQTETDSQNAQECLKPLLSKPYNIPMDQVDEKGLTRLHKIQTKTPVSIVQLLDHDGYTPLAVAVNTGNESVAKYLIEQGARVDVFGPGFGSILHLAVSKGSINIVKLLVNSGADRESVHPEYGESLLYTALSIEDDSNLEKIVRYLVDEAKVPINQPGGELGYPIIRIAERARSKHASSVKMLKFLIRRKVQVNVTDSQGRRAVHFACASQYDDGLKALVNARADIEAQDRFGRKPIHFAAAVPSTKCIDFLLDKIHDINSVNVADHDNWTPLLWAARSSNQDIIAKLVARGADVWVRGHAYGEEAEWSALKLANFAGWIPHSGNELEPKERTRVNQNGEIEVWDDDFHRIQAGHKKDALCKSCLVAITGIQWECIECDEEFSLCFKCYSYRTDIHTPGHNFNRIEPLYDTDDQAIPDAYKGDEGERLQDSVEENDEAQAPAGGSDEDDFDLAAFLAE